VRSLNALILHSWNEGAANRDLGSDRIVVLHGGHPARWGRSTVVGAGHVERDEGVALSVEPGLVEQPDPVRIWVGLGEPPARCTIAISPSPEHSLRLALVGRAYMVEEEPLP